MQIKKMEKRIEAIKGKLARMGWCSEIGIGQLQVL